MDFSAVIEERFKVECSKINSSQKSQLFQEGRLQTSVEKTTVFHVTGVAVDTYYTISSTYGNTGFSEARLWSHVSPVPTLGFVATALGSAFSQLADIFSHFAHSRCRAFRSGGKTQ